ncbi:MAG: 30S ribosome-binding factor RbfA [Lactobacillaceae bacterium]|jgi:ribosome-binding factor A|nr:30S ribosome-binding factor RbfA [Lactobacillaceae bacterium]
MAIKELSQRQLKVGQEIRKIIAGLIERGEIRNLQEFDALVTITEVRVSPDLKYSNVYFISSDDTMNEQVLEGLQLAANYFRKQIAAKTDLRYVPEVVFKIDESFAEVDKIEKLLHDDRVKRDLKKSV